LNHFSLQEIASIESASALPSMRKEGMASKKLFVIGAGEHKLQMPGV